MVWTTKSPKKSLFVVTMGATGLLFASPLLSPWTGPRAVAQPTRGGVPCLSMIQQIATQPGTIPQALQHAATSITTGTPPAALPVVVPPATDVGVAAPPIPPTPPAGVVDTAAGALPPAPGAPGAPIGVPGALGVPPGPGAPGTGIFNPVELLIPPAPPAPGAPLADMAGVATPPTPPAPGLPL
ncbi:MAG: hypothetical protein DIU75_018575, partial [Mycolicibacterium hassiacum]